MGSSSRKPRSGRDAVTRREFFSSILPSALLKGLRKSGHSGEGTGPGAQQGEGGQEAHLLRPGTAGESPFPLRGSAGSQEIPGGSATVESKSGPLLAVVLHERCLAWGGGGCRMCATVCPEQAVIFVDEKPAVNVYRCNGCGICEEVCATVNVGGAIVLRRP